jgi:integrase
VTANRAIQLLKRLFNFARIEPNPAAGRAVKYFRESTRDRFLQPAELPRLFRALDEADELIRDFILLSLFTGQRRSNVQSMRWDEIDLSGRLWTIPGEKTKAHLPISVPLTQAAMDILMRRQSSCVDSPYVFPGDGASGHLVEPKTAWKSIRKRAGIVNLTLHDLRRSMASWMAIRGTSLPIIGKALGHKSPTATAIYSRLTMDPVRHGVDAATAAMLAAGKANGDAGDED